MAVSRICVCSQSASRAKNGPCVGWRGVFDIRRRSRFLLLTRRRRENFLIIHRLKSSGLSCSTRICNCGCCWLLRGSLIMKHAKTQVPPPLSPTHSLKAGVAGVRWLCISSVLWTLGRTPKQTRWPHDQWATMTRNWYLSQKKKVTENP